MWPKVAVEEGRDTGMDRHRFPTEQQYPEQGKQTKDPLLDHENARVRMVSPAQIQIPCHSSHHMDLQQRIQVPSPTKEVWPTPVQND